MVIRLAFAIFLVAVRALAAEIGSRPTGLAVAPDGRLLVQTSTNGIVVADLDRMYEPFRTTWLTAYRYTNQTGDPHHPRFRADGKAFLILVQNVAYGDAESTLYIVDAQSFEELDQSVNDALAAEFLAGTRVLVLKAAEIIVWDYANSEVVASLPVEGGSAIAVEKEVAWIGRKDGVVMRWPIGGKAESVAKCDGAIRAVRRVQAGIVVATADSVALWSMTGEKQGEWKTGADRAGPVSGSDGAQYMLLHEHGAVALSEIGGGRRYAIRLPASANLDDIVVVDDARQRILTGNGVDKESRGLAETVVFDLKSGLPIAQLGRDTVGRKRCLPGDGARIPASLLEKIAGDAPAGDLIDASAALLRRFYAKRDVDRRAIAQLLRRLVPAAETALHARLSILASHDPESLRSAVLGMNDEWVAERRRVLAELRRQLNMLPPANGARSRIAATMEEEIEAIRLDVALETCILAEGPREIASCVREVEALARRHPANYRVGLVLVQTYLGAGRDRQAARAARSFEKRFSFGAPGAYGCAEDFLDWNIPSVTLFRKRSR